MPGGDAARRPQQRQRTLGNTMPLPPCALISSTRALSGPHFVESILTGMHLQPTASPERCVVPVTALGHGVMVCSVVVIMHSTHPAPSNKPLAIW